MTQSAAHTAITGAGLTVGTVTQADSATVPSGQVISQTPAPGATLLPGAVVNLVVSQSPQPVAVPNVVGMTQSAAQTAITDALLSLGTVTQVYSATVPMEDVISQTPAAGASVVLGTAVNLTVSQGQAPIRISNILDLQKIGNDPAYSIGGIYVLTQEIDASATLTWNNGAGFLPIGNETSPFTGVFDGQGYVISGLTINRPGQNCIGLFGYVAGPDSQVRNVGLQGGTILGDESVGALIGCNYGSVTACYATGSISVSGADYYTGCLIGFNGLPGTVAHCYAAGTVFRSRRFFYWRFNWL
jgi:hypothetical protein